MNYNNVETNRVGTKGSGVPGSTVASVAASQSGALGLVPQPILLTYGEATYHDPMVVCSSGGPGSGKSRFIATAPGVGLIPTEFKSKGTVLKDAARLGRQILCPDQDLIRVGDPLTIANLENTCIVVGDKRYPKPSDVQEAMQEIAATIRIDGPPILCCKRHYYRWHVNRVKSVAYAMLYDARVKTIAFDTMGQFVDDVSFANYGLAGKIDGEDFGFAPRQDMNQEIRDLLNALNRKNLILTHHLADVWQQGKPTGKTKPKSQFSGIGHYATVMLEFRRYDANAMGAGRYQVFVKDCQSNPGVIRPEALMADDDVNWDQLEEAVYGDE